MTGIYYLPLPTLCHEVGIRPKRALAALEVLNREGFAEYDHEASVVWVPEMARCQVGNDPKPDDKRIKGFLRELEAVAHPVFVGKFIAKYRDAFHLDEESLRGVLRGGFLSKMAAPEAPSKDHRSPIEGPSKPHRSPAPAPAPAPAPEPGEESALAEEELFRIWNENRGSMKKASDLTEGRRRKIKTRLREIPNLDRWRAAIQRLARGWGGKQGWAKIDFLIRDDTNIVKIEEGTYDESTSRGIPAAASRTSRRSPTDWDLAEEEPLAAESAPRGRPQ
jgi:hypothetical protein